VAAEIVIIVVVTLFATISLLLGLDKGIRFLSEWNMRLAVLLLVIVIIFGPTLYIFNSFFQNIGYYAANFIEIGLWSGSYDAIIGDNSWHTDWTIFYWAWWIAWCPFVGIFIARVSRGRTIREFRA
jgi:choline/glycine/proline betaine transport protein